VPLPADSNLFDKLRSLTKLGQYDLAHSVIPTHNFISDTLEPSPVLSVQVLFRAIENVRDAKVVHALLVAQGLARRDVKPVRDLVDGIAHELSLADAETHFKPLKV